MFGEDESESPRVPSPWDSLISTPPESIVPSRQSPSPLGASVTTNSSLVPLGLPKLVPEMEEGNVEYKLQLLNPSPARFARLVTQLKWRLLEGGGQAYYELGVADSGVLVGLHRDELERTLETLEMMAGEIGASVIVVKEIEVPACMRVGADTRERADSWRGDDLDGKFGRGKTRHCGRHNGTADALWSSSYEGETEGYSTTASSTSPIEQDDSEFSTDAEASESTGLTHEPSGTIFDMDSETQRVDPASKTPTINAPHPPSNLSRTHSFTVDLEISSVYKPRPMRRRVLDPRFVIPGKRDRRHGHGKVKDASHTKDSVKGAYGHARITYPRSAPAVMNPAHTIGTSHHTQNGDPNDIKALTRREVRDRRREEKRRLLTKAAETAISVDGSRKDDLTPEPTSAPLTQGAIDHIVDGLNDMHVSLVDSVPALRAPPRQTSTLTAVPDSQSPTKVYTEDDKDDDVINIRVLPPLDRTLKRDPDDAPRLIVEALVVRKMSLDEGFLDFGGFEVV